MQSKTATARPGPQPLRGVWPVLRVLYTSGVLVNKLIILIMLMLFSFDGLASKPVAVHSHKYYSEGVLPEPYNTYTLRVELDEETDDVSVMEFHRGSEFVFIPRSIIEQLKEIDLGTLALTHEMHRSIEEPASSFHQGDSDWFHIQFEMGEDYRVERIENGITYFKWGRDLMTVTITNGNNVTVHKRSLKDTRGDWMEKSQ